ncbi:MAG: hypothetical protein HMLKMBBP_03068 [Planctomycetes bacterium]|nr:hypothetical protein [Planctomycetota bacterium]
MNLNGQPGAPSPCDAIRDTPRNRTSIATGAGPRSITSDSFILNKCLTTNSLDSSVTVIDVKQSKAVNTHKTGSNPVDADFTMFAFGGVDIAAVVNQGGVQDPNGSVSMYLRIPRVNIFQDARDGIESTLTDGVKNPTAVFAVQQWVDCNPLSPRYGYALSTGTVAANQWFVANTGGDTVLDLRVSVQGSFGQLVSFNPAATRKVGLNPTSAMYDGFNPTAPYLWVALGGLGQVGGMEPTRVLPPVTKSVPGVRRFFTAFTH